MAYEKAEGVGLKKVLLNYGRGLHKKPKGEKKKGSKPKGLRMRKTVRGKIISDAMRQINLKVTKEGKKKLAEIFPEQNKIKEQETPVEKPAEEAKPIEKPAEKPAKETKPVEEPKFQKPKSIQNLKQQKIQKPQNIQNKSEKIEDKERIRKMAEEL